MFLKHDFSYQYLHFEDAIPVVIPNLEKNNPGFLQWDYHSEEDEPSSSNSKMLNSQKNLFDFSERQFQQDLVMKLFWADCYI